MTPSVPRQRVIPIGGWIAAGIIFLVMFLGLGLVMIYTDDNIPLPVRIFIPIFAGCSLGGYATLVAYVYGDARRRGMRHVMWTLLAAFIPNAIGIILYFILRDPMPVHCSHCGSLTHPTHAFCPRCGAPVQPSCTACHRPVQAGWTHCASCGRPL